MLNINPEGGNEGTVLLGGGFDEERWGVMAALSPHLIPMQQVEKTDPGAPEF